jgi:hypothetical protein
MPTSSIPASGGGGLIPKYQKFTSSGTFTLPDGYGAAKPLVITIQVIGGGGGGTASLGTSAFPAVGQVKLIRTDYFGNEHAFFPVNIGTQPSAGGSSQDFSSNQNGWGGGSGGIAQTQMSLTSNLTVTVGAAGARITASNTATPRFATGSWGRGSTSNTGATTFNVNFYDTAGTTTMSAGGTGGTSTAGAVSATGGVGGGAGNFGVNANSSGTITFPSDVNIDSGNSIGPFGGTLPTLSGFNTANGNAGSAGQPAGSAGGAVPLLGALAGGSGNTTPVYGAFGVGGKRGDLGTHSGVEGTGGGYGSIGASGAVIISYWA